MNITRDTAIIAREALDQEMLRGSALNEDMMKEAYDELDKELRNHQQSE